MTLPRVTLVGMPKGGLIYDQRSLGWELLEEGPMVEGEPTLGFLGFLRKGETLVNGDTVLARTLEMDGNVSGQHHLERLLAQAASIPPELRHHYLVATGTKWRDPHGRVYVPGLDFLGYDKWELHFGRVGRVIWHGRGRVVRVCM